MVIGYLRESKEHNNSLSQKEAIASKFSPVVFFSDITSGFTDALKRPGFKSMMQFLDDNPGMEVVVNSFERLGRGKEVLNATIDLLLTRSSKITSVREKISITRETLVQYEEYINALGVVSKFEADLLVTRLNEGRAAYVKNGGKLGAATHKKLDPKEQRDALEKKYYDAIVMLKKGYTIRYVARVFNVSPTTIQKIKHIFINYKE